MGKVSIFTKEQEIILVEVAKNDFLREQFYFTGGTALSTVYFKHRHSEDLDLFSEKSFDAQELLDIVEEWSKKYTLTITRRQTGNIHVYLLTFPNKEILKVDFVSHPYKRIEKGTVFRDIQVDSLVDIATNKLLTINQRTEIKDFVDLYFLLKHYTVWDLMEGLRVKYNMKTEPFFIASDFTKMEDFKGLPRMIKPLSLSELKSFFREEAKKLGRQAVE